MQLEDGTYLAFVLRHRDVTATPGHVKEEYLKALGLTRDESTADAVQDFRPTTVVCLWNEPLPVCAMGPGDCRVWNAGDTFHDPTFKIRAATSLVVVQEKALQQLFVG